MNTKETIKETIEADIAREQIGIDLFNQLVEIFKPFEGKKISKRLATAIEKALPDYTVSYSTDYGHYSIRIWGNGIDFNERYDFLIGYESNPYYNEGPHEESHSGFRDFSGRYGFHAEERNVKRKAYLEDDSELSYLSNAIEDYKEAVGKLNSISNFDFPSWHSVTNSTGVKGYNKN